MPKLKSIRAIWLILSILAAISIILVVITFRRTGNVAAVDQATSIARKCAIEGIYYGTSERTNDRLGWLIEISTDHAKLMMPPGVLRSRSISCENGRLHIEFEPGMGESRYTIDGELIADGAKTMISAKGLDSSDVLLKPTGKCDRQDTLNGNYSNVEYNEDGGDLVGDSVLMFCVEGELKAIYVSYDNGMLPYDVSVTVRDNEVEMMAKINSENSGFRGLVSNSSLRISSPNHSATLKRIGDYRQVFDSVSR